MAIEEIGKQDNKEQKINLEDVLTSFEVALLEQGRELSEQKQRIAMLEYALRKHINNIDMAHKL